MGKNQSDCTNCLKCLRMLDTKGWLIEILSNSNSMGADCIELHIIAGNIFRNNTFCSCQVATNPLTSNGTYYTAHILVNNTYNNIPGFIYKLTSAYFVVCLYVMYKYIIFYDTMIDQTVLTCCVCARNIFINMQNMQTEEVCDIQDMQRWMHNVMLIGHWPCIRCERFEINFDPTVLMEDLDDEWCIYRVSQNYIMTLSHYNLWKRYVASRYAKMNE